MLWWCHPKIRWPNSRSLVKPIGWRIWRYLDATSETPKMVAICRNPDELCQTMSLKKISLPSPSQSFPVRPSPPLASTRRYDSPRVAHPVRPRWGFFRSAENIAAGFWMATQWLLNGYQWLKVLGKSLGKSHGNPPSSVSLRCHGFF